MVFEVLHKVEKQDSHSFVVENAFSRITQVEKVRMLEEPMFVHFSKILEMPEDVLPKIWVGPYRLDLTDLFLLVLHSGLSWIIQDCLVVFAQWSPVPWVSGGLPGLGTTPDVRFLHR